jgi:tRNA(Arg) A34 adenosine deaminase TadA
MAKRKADERHKQFMLEAIKMVLTTSALTDGCSPTSQAETALQTDETPVGCVFVYNGEVISRGMNDTNKSLNVGSRSQESSA